MQKITSAEMPFSTQDALLACSLHFAGVPFKDDRLPCFNVYDEARLARLGFVDMPLEDATRAAFESGEKGTVKYMLEKTGNLSELLAAFSEREAELKSKDGTAIEMAREFAKRYAIPADEMVRFLCLVLKMRGLFVNMWKDTVPLMSVPHDGKPITREEANVTVTNYPGVRLVRLDASAEERAHMKV